MNIIIFSFSMVVYIGITYFGVRSYGFVLRTIYGKDWALRTRITIEWIAATIYIVLLVPFGIFFPMYANEVLEVLERTSSTSNTLFLSGGFLFGLMFWMGQQHWPERARSDG